MGASQLEAIADAGPLIHLTEIGRLSLLSIFTQIHIPNAVWSETVSQGRVPADDLHELQNITRYALSQQAVADFILDNNLAHLHSGECECLYLCQQINIFTLLTDDLSAREAAKKLNRQPVGSLGIIVKAYKMGRLSLPLAEQYLHELYMTSTLFVTKAIVNIAIQQLHQQSK